MRWARTMAVAVSALAISACHDARGVTAAAPRVGVAPPPACRTVAAGEPVQPALDDPAATAVCLAPGAHAGPLRLTRAVTLWGPADAVVTSAAGTVIELAAAGAAVVGLTIDGTGGRFDALDAAVRIAASDTRVEATAVVHAMFGILVEQSRRVRIIGNRIAGGREPALGLRGDTIRLWETSDSQVTDNVVEDGRDVVVWYSRGNQITGNRVVRGRYGLHFMYSHDNQVTGNQLLDGVVGIFVMYSRGLRLADNLIAGAAGAAGMAIGLKDSGNITVTDNQLIHDAVGIYLDSSPMQRGDRVEVARNVLRLNDTAVVFHASGHRVQIHDNDLADNQVQVRVDGGGDAVDVAWRANYFDDYAGYDLDGDGVGDVPYELRSLANQLTARVPGLAVFRGTPALALVDAAAHLDPLYLPQPLLADPAPRMAPRWAVDRIARTP
jgi:nitrous oxidase accessory protein